MRNDHISCPETPVLQGELLLNEFIQKLRSVETMHKRAINSRATEDAMWFKFSEDDTLATTIDELQRDLSNSNRDLILERIREALTADNKLFIRL